MAVDLENKVLVIQALVRGYLVRQKFQEIRHEFEGIVAELENNTKFVHWKKQELGHPVITSETSLHGTNKLFSIGVSGDTIGDNVAAAEKTNVSESDESYKLSSVPSDFTRNEPTSSDKKDIDVTTRREIRDQETRISENENNLGTSLIPGTVFLAGNQESEVPSSGDLNGLHNHHRSEHSPWEIAVPTVAVPLCSTPQCSTVEPGDDEWGVARPSRSKSEDKLQLQNKLVKDQRVLSETWLTDKSFDPVTDEESNSLPTDPVKLQQLRDHISMELIWTEQAIESRKKYLSLKKGMVQSDLEEEARVSWE